MIFEQSCRDTNSVLMRQMGHEVLSGILRGKLPKGSLLPSAEEIEDELGIDVALTARLYGNLFNMGAITKPSEADHHPMVCIDKPDPEECAKLLTAEADMLLRMVTEMGVDEIDYLEANITSIKRKREKEKEAAEGGEEIKQRK